MCASSRIPVNPEILIWARKQFNMSTGSVADRAGLKEKQIIAWENGTESPTYRQLENLAYKVYLKPIEIFFYPLPPEMPKPDVKLRAFYGEYSLDTPTDILLVMNQAEIMQNNLRDLCRGQNPSNNLITHKIFDGSLKDCSKRVRECLSAPLDEQIQLSDYYAALKYWRGKLADAGIYIFKENFKNISYSGFCLDDPEFPIIYLNSEMPPQRQIFTIFHELYHLLKKKSGIDFMDDERIIPKFAPSIQQIEKKCDEFASEFLVPSDDFIQTINNLKIKEILEYDNYSDVMNNCIKPLKRRYVVSHDMIVLKLINTGYISSSDYYRFKSPESKTKKSSGGPDYYTTTVSHLGEPYINLVREKQVEYGFENYLAAEFMGVKTKSLEGIEKKLRGAK